MTFHPELKAHLASGATTVCHAWRIERTDGVIHSFTDHDRDLVFDGVTFRADTGLSALALQQGTGLSVDNSEAIGALSDASIREVDIEAGRFDEARLTAWLVNWSDVSARQIVFDPLSRYLNSIHIIIDSFMSFVQAWMPVACTRISTNVTFTQFTFRNIF